MTDREKAIVMAYTGVVMLCGDKLSIFYQYVREKLGHCVMTHELAFPEVQDAIKDAAKNDFIELVKDNNVPGNGWISVRDRLPNDYQPVIVSDGEEPEFAIFYDHYNGYGPTFVTPDCYEEERIEGITHWMPLPEPPKEG